LASASSLLETLLRQVADSGTANVAELARQLQVPPPVVQLMLEQLVRLDYLRTVLTGATACERCPFHAACAYRQQARIWVMTAKGAGYLERQ
jgi:hypothetical protein